jgi:hypothetical protein
MSNRDFGVVALGRFLAVERYREASLSLSANQLQSPVPDRTGSEVDTSDSRSSSRVPAGRRAGRGMPPLHHTGPSPRDRRRGHGKGHRDELGDA